MRRLVRAVVPAGWFAPVINRCFVANTSPSRHLLIIASDPDKAGRLVEACRHINAAAQYTPDPIHGLIQAMHDEPAMLLIDADDAWLGGVSVIQEVRRHPTLCFTPVMLLTGDAPCATGPGGIEHGADYVTSLNAPDLAHRIRACFSAGAAEIPKPRASVISRAARAAKAVAVKVTSHLSANQAERPSLTVALGDLMCDGNLFRRIGDSDMLYELRIAREKLMLIPIQRGLTPYCFEDAETLLENFQYLPFA